MDVRSRLTPTWRPWSEHLHPVSGHVRSCLGFAAELTNPITALEIIDTAEELRRGGLSGKAISQQVWASAVGVNQVGAGLMVLPALMPTINRGRTAMS